jgi:uncharacterized protein (TIGR03437 family)
MRTNMASPNRPHTASTMFMTALMLTVRLCCAQPLGRSQPSSPQATESQSNSVVILQIETANKVTYYYDVFDYNRMATDPNPATPPALTKPFLQWVDIADIVRVNGSPAKGTWVDSGLPILRLQPGPGATPGPGYAVADVTRNSMVQHYVEILQTDGTQVGTIMATGFNFGDPPPGAPTSVTRDNLTIVGGTGAFLGARGQAGNSVPARISRNASVTENPANRRDNGGGPAATFVLHLIPLSYPAIESLTSGPAVFHADFSPVTVAAPARSGEVLVLRATGLGPTRPGVDPGQPFPQDATKEVNSPLEVTVNGQIVEVLNKIGWPGLVDTYRVDFRMPNGIAKGMAAIQMSVAWISGSAVSIPTQ